MNPNEDKKRISNFERALFIALSRNGLLMPVNEKQAEEFETRTGTTKIEVPSELQESDLMFTPNNKRSVKSEPQIRRYDEIEEFHLKVASTSNKPKKRKKK